MYFDVPSFDVYNDMEQIMTTNTEIGNYLFNINDDCELIMTL